MTITFEYDPEKAFAAVVYLASKPDIPGLDKLKISKLLFLADKYHLVRFGRPIVGDAYRALNLGPVPQKTIDYLHALVEPSKAGWVDAETRQKFADALDIDHSFAYPRFSSKQSIDFSSLLSKSDIAALDHVIQIHSMKSGSELSALTHAMPAYIKAWQSRGEEKYVEMSYEDFFEEDSDAIEGALEEMRENDQLAKAFPAV